MTFIKPLDPPAPGGAAAKAAGTLGRGAARLSIGERDGKSYLDERYFTDPYRIFTPRTAPGEPVSIVLSTLSGGLVGGDQLNFHGRVKARAAGQFVGQAAEKIYGSSGDTTKVAFGLDVDAGGWLEQVPQETILFDGSMLDRRFDIRVEEGAQALVGDLVVLGRLAMGEQFTRGAFADTWTLYCGERLVWCDRMGFSGEQIMRIRQDAFGLGGAQAFATVLYAGSNAAQVVELVRDHAAAEQARALGLRLGVTCLGEHTLIRLMGEGPQHVRLVLGDIWKQVRSEMGGFAPRLPTLWSI